MKFPLPKALKGLISNNMKPLIGTPWSKAYDPNASLEDIYYCFRLILGRNPSEAEWDGHSSTLSGHPLKNVMLSYLTSTEFKARNLGEVSLDEIQLIELPGHKMYVPINDPQVGLPVYRDKTYEPHIVNFFQKHIKEGDTFLDLGANIGFFSLLAASLVGENGKVFSFEPFSENVKFLYLSKEVNGYDNIEIVPMAVSDVNGLCLFDNSGSNGFIRPISNEVSRVIGSTPVYSVRLDSYFDDVDKIDFIKIDTEGAEYIALMGAGQLLETHRPVIVSEFSVEALLATSRIEARKYLELLLIDSSYQLGIFDGMGIISCGRDIEKLLRIFEESGAEHIDIVSSPSD